MKKLMILGGSRYALPVIKAAKQLGIYTITADYLPDNIAHRFSDEYVNVSIIDKEKTLEAAKEHNIDESFERLQFFARRFERSAQEFYGAYRNNEEVIDKSNLESSNCKGYKTLVRLMSGQRP